MVQFIYLGVTDPDFIVCSFIENTIGLKRVKKYSQSQTDYYHSVETSHHHMTSLDTLSQAVHWSSLSHKRTKCTVKMVLFLLVLVTNPSATVTLSTWLSAVADPEGVQGFCTCDKVCIGLSVYSTRQLKNTIDSDSMIIVCLCWYFTSQST